MKNNYTLFETIMDMRYRDLASWMVLSLITIPLTLIVVFFKAWGDAIECVSDLFGQLED